jgi:phospholipid transport system substrate-binding protein
MYMGRIITGLLLLIGSGLLQAQQDPLALVMETADTVLKEVVAHKAELNKDSSGIYVLVSNTILPHFDFNKMTQSAMGKYWGRASETQKASITQQFQQLLVRTYGVALLNYSGQEIVYLPLRTTDDANLVTVQTRVKEANGGPEIPVDYRLEFNDNAWKVYDVVIDGISLVSNYRTSFSGEIRRAGIDGLIEQLMLQNKS